MEYLKAAITEVAEAGTFSAYASAFGNIDRTGERVVKGAFRETIASWRQAGRDVPLVWDHKVGAHDVIGSIDSATMQERDAGLYVEGTLDIRDSEMAREAWRSVKKGRISLSFGYLIEDERTGADGVKELTRLDLMEVTLTVVPANPSARVLGWKSATATAGLDLEDLTHEEFRERSLTAAAEVLDGAPATTELNEAERQTYRELRREYEAEKAKAAEVDAEEVHTPLPPPRSRITYNGTTWRKVPADEPGGATDEEVDAHEKAMHREHAEREVIHRARAARAKEEPAVISVCGFRVRVDDGRIVGR